MKKFEVDYNLIKKTSKIHSEKVIMKQQQLNGCIIGTATKLKITLF